MKSCPDWLQGQDVASYFRTGKLISSVRQAIGLQKYGFAFTAPEQDTYWQDFHMASPPERNWYGKLYVEDFHMASNR
jgi:hypothetical protein